MEDKFNVIRNAERHVITRQYGRAITEYQQLLEKYGEDPSILNTLGDLLLRNQQREEALSCFYRVAEIFSRSGFVAKAIGLCRKIEQLEPSDAENLTRLSELYRRRGLRSEATRYLNRLIDVRSQVGDKTAAREVLNQVIELNPDDPKPLRQLGDLVAEETPQQAAAFFLQAARLHLPKREEAEALECVRESLRLDPGNLEALQLRFEIDPDAEDLLEGSALSDDAHELEDGSLIDPKVAVGDSEVEDLTEALSEPFPETFSQPESGNPEEEAVEDASEEFRLVLNQSAEVGNREDEPAPQDSDLLVEPPSESNEFFLSGIVTEKWKRGDAQLHDEPPEEPITDDPGAAAEAAQTPTGEVSVPVDAAAQAAEEERPAGEEPLEGAQEEAAEDLEGFKDVLEDASPKEVAAAADGEPQASTGEEEPDLQDRLEEIDFYIKLDLKDDARKLARDLADKYPGAHEVRVRMQRLESLEESSSRSAVSVETTFDEEVEGALEDLFFVETERTSSASPEGIDAKEDVAQSEYDLGVGYQEMGMLADAAEKFQRAYALFSDETRHSEASLCCTMLTASFLQQNNYRRAAEWADIGLSLPEVREGEWIQLEYDRALALEQMGETEESLAGYRRVLERDPGFRDVQDRVAALDSLT